MSSGLSWNIETWLTSGYVPLTREHFPSISTQPCWLARLGCKTLPPPLSVTRISLNKSVQETKTWRTRGYLLSGADFCSSNSRQHPEVLNQAYTCYGRWFKLALAVTPEQSVTRCKHHKRGAGDRAKNCAFGKNLPPTV